MTVFTIHTAESAPTAARRVMAAVEAKQGYLPTAVALLAESPETLEGLELLPCSACSRRHKHAWHSRLVWWAWPDGC